MPFTVDVHMIGVSASDPKRTLRNIHQREDPDDFGRTPALGGVPRIAAAKVPAEVPVMLAVMRGVWVIPQVPH